MTPAPRIRSDPLPRAPPCPPHAAPAQRRQEAPDSGLTRPPRAFGLWTLRRRVSGEGFTRTVQTPGHPGEGQEPPAPLPWPPPRLCRPTGGLLSPALTLTASLRVQPLPLALSWPQSQAGRPTLQGPGDPESLAFSGFPSPQGGCALREPSAPLS